MDNGTGPAPGPSHTGRRSRAGTGSHRHHRRRRGASILNELAVSSAVKQKFRDGLKRKLAFHTDLLRNLDMVVYAEICVLYYMDCSFLRLVFRSLVHSMFFSPKAEELQIPCDFRRLHVYALFFSNLFCLVLHATLALPTASEANRGYLHGGVMIDFVGQAAPTSACGLMLIDGVIFCVQCVIMAVNSEREKLRRIVNPPRETAQAASSIIAAARALGLAATGAEPAASQPQARQQPPAPAPTLADHDAEERGERQRRPAETAEGIEMATRLRSGTNHVAAPAHAPAPASAPAPAPAPTPYISSEVEQRLRELQLGGPEATPEQTAEDFTVAMVSGGSIGDFRLWNTMVLAYRETDSSPASAAATTAQSLQAISNTIRLARLAAQRRAPEAGVGGVTVGPANPR